MQARLRRGRGEARTGCERRSFHHDCRCGRGKEPLEPWLIAASSTIPRNVDYLVEKDLLRNAMPLPVHLQGRDDRSPTQVLRGPRSPSCTDKQLTMAKIAEDINDLHQDAHTAIDKSSVFIAPTELVQVITVNGSDPMTRQAVGRCGGESNAHLPVSIDSPRYTLTEAASYITSICPISRLITHEDICKALTRLA